jgi:hypothetical protein
LPSCGEAAVADGNSNTNIEYICIGTDLLTCGTNRKVKWLDRRYTAWLTCNPNRPAPPAKHATCFTINQDQWWKFMSSETPCLVES